MGEKFIFITKKDPDQKFTAQKSLDRENEFIVMWQTKSGRLCGILYDELEIKKWIDNGHWIVIENLNILEVW